MVDTSQTKWLLLHPPLTEMSPGTSRVNILTQNRPKIHLERNLHTKTHGTLFFCMFVTLYFVLVYRVNHLIL